MQILNNGQGVYPLVAAIEHSLNSYPTLQRAVRAYWTLTLICVQLWTPPSASQGGSISLKYSTAACIDMCRSSKEKAWQGLR